MSTETRQVRPKNPDQITPAMVKAGVIVFYELEGEVSKERLARAVFEAMTEARRLSGHR
jgi:hypothetical protein